MLNGPGITSGHRVSGLSEGVDLVPTLSELFDLPMGAVHGDSRLAQVQGSEKTGETTVFSETWYANEHHARWTTPEFTYVHNYIQGKRGEDRGERELYAATDGEQATLVDDLETAKALEAEMEVLRQALYEERVVWEGEEMSEDLEKQLQGLGYVDE